MLRKRGGRDRLRNISFAIIYTLSAGYDVVVVTASHICHVIEFLNYILCKSLIISTFPSPYRLCAGVSTTQRKLWLVAPPPSSPKAEGRANLSIFHPHLFK